VIDRWDDLRVLLAVARHGTLTKAAAALNVDGTTTSRRMRALQDALGTRLFDRLRGGVELTPAGAALVRLAERWEALLLDAGREIEAERSAVEGIVRVGVPELLLPPLYPTLKALTAVHGALTVQVVASDRFSSLTRREADIAVRVSRAAPEHLIATSFGDLETAVYAPTSRDEESLEDVPWIGWDPEDAPEGELELARRRSAPGARYVLQVNTYGALLDAVRVGLGAAMLPCVTGDAIEGLTRRTAPRVAGTTWLLVHPEVRRAARIRVVGDALARALAAWSR